MTQEVEALKAAGRHREAGRLARRLNLPRDYGCHYGMRSDRLSSRDAFFAGYDEAVPGASSIEPHPALALVTPDVVAECWNGVFSFGNLYEQLWENVARYESIDRENCGPNDVIGINSVALFWVYFSVENQLKLNELAASQEAEIEALLGEV